ncbi:MAG: cysteine--tRNA ligase [Proteobacteria bacterium]|nr:cysteine--tRNA ligase [Pseudomonadota bacterium]MCP4919632.1 cysteine--tRNA ligase [Pseudomonadota bacterium]
MLQVYNSLGRTLETFTPAQPGKVSMYVCGMTVYDYCHIGHARAMITFDIVFRYLKWKGYDVTYVRNYTDVDDKIIQRAAENGEHPLELSQRFIEFLNEDLEALGLDLPTEQPKVSDNIDGIIALNASLIERGHAYASDGDVYFSVESFETYGKLSGKKVDDLIAGKRVAVGDKKRFPADFALWKAAKDGEVAWDSPWGRGRPGWHIECSVMSMKHLGETFDIHGGGIDLIFPHHENEIAQSECGTGHGPFSRYWLHNGHLTIESSDAEDGCEKMSKSLGNVVNIRDILKEVPAEALKLLYLQSHYRSPLPYSADRLAESISSLDRIYVAKEAAVQLGAKAPKATLEQLSKEGHSKLVELVGGFRQRFEDAMDQDFNTAKAIGDLFELTRSINRASNDKALKKRGAALFAAAAELFDLYGDVMGFGGSDPDAWFEEFKLKRLKSIGMEPSWVEERLQGRLAARAEKDWAAADAIRDELLESGVIVMDGPDGSVTWRMRAC